MLFRSPRWLLSRPLVGAPTGIPGDSLARPTSGRVPCGLVETRFPSQRLPRRQGLTLGTAMMSGMASTLRSALAPAGFADGADEVGAVFALVRDRRREMRAIRAKGNE